MEVSALELLSSLERLTKQIISTAPELIGTMRSDLVLVTGIEVRIVNPDPWASEDRCCEWWKTSDEIIDRLAQLPCIWRVLARVEKDWFWAWLAWTVPQPR
jgi:hypothetical protein